MPYRAGEKKAVRCTKTINFFPHRLGEPSPAFAIRLARRGRDVTNLGLGNENENESRICAREKGSREESADRKLECL